MYPFILGYLNRAKISWAMGDWGGRGPRGPPPLNTPLVDFNVEMDMADGWKDVIDVQDRTLDGHW